MTKLVANPTPAATSVQSHKGVEGPDASRIIGDKQLACFYV